MTKTSYAAWQTESVEDLTGLVGVVQACRLVGRSRATHHRHAHPKPRVHGPRRRPVHPAELSTVEREEILALLNSDAYANSSVTQAWARELDEGRYWCSARTMYRILAAAGMGGERRRQATHPPRTIPELVATCANAVWSWDITKMRGPGKGSWYHAYVVIDIFSRYVLGCLDVRRSHNRPRTSNDTPYSESQFKTMKYMPDYPDRFASIGEARAWMAAFTNWYNHEHRHSGIGLHTPASVHYGTAADIRDARQRTLNAPTKSSTCSPT
jgi:putative transposase